MLANKLLSSTSTSGGKPQGGLDISDVFSTYLYIGNGSTQTITNGIDLAGEGGMVWLKNRSSASYDHHIVDSDTGNFSYALATNSTRGKTFDFSTYSYVSALNANGFSLAVGAGDKNDVNASSVNYASWTFRKAPRFFTQEVINHISGTPTNVDLSILNEVGMVTVKATSTTSNWYTWHRSLTAGNNLKLNLIDAQSTTNAYLSVSGTTLTVSASAPSATYIVYAWAHDPLGASGDGSDSLIQCGSTPTYGYVELGFEPQYVLYRRLDGTSDWAVADINRGFGAGHYKLLRANTGDAEVEIGGGGVNSWITPTGFYCSGFGAGAYIYMAIPRSMKEPTTSDEVFAVSTASQSYNAVVPAGFPVDMYLTCTRTNNPSGYGVCLFDRLRGGYYLKSSSSVAEATLGSKGGFDVSDGVYPGMFSQYPSTWMFRRAKGFFDVVCYTGDGVAGRTVNHNLGVVPEMMIVKKRNAAQEWNVYLDALGATRTLWLNDSSIGNTHIDYWYNTSPTSTVFSLGGGNPSNFSGSTYIAYLFASLPGVSKVGSYTGNGTSQTINCDFTTGAKFVLIKRTDSNSDWYIWDSVRGIVAANDPHLSLNTTAAEVTTDDSIDPDSSGFIVNQNTATNINVSGGKYIYYAIAN